MDTKEKTLTIKLSPDVHRKLKVVSSENGCSIKGFITSIVNDAYENLFKKREIAKDKENIVEFEVDGENFIIEPATEEDMYIFERGQKEIEKGEYYEIKNEEELDNEDNNTKISKE